MITPCNSRYALIKPATLLDTQGLLVYNYCKSCKMRRLTCLLASKKIGHIWTVDIASRCMPCMGVGERRPLRWVRRASAIPPGDAWILHRLLLVWACRLRRKIGPCGIQRKPEASWQLIIW